MLKRAYPLTLVLASLALVVFGATSSAQAQSQALNDPHLGVKLELGLGGSATTTWGNRDPAHQNLEVGIGLGGQYLYPLHEYFSLGGLLDFQSWRSTGDGEGGRNFVFDLAVLPQGKYRLTEEIELNVSVPLGLAVDMLNEVDWKNGFVVAGILNGGGSLEGNTAFGFMLGALLGARYSLKPNFGLLLELGYIHRSVGHVVTTSANVGFAGGDTKTDVTVSWGQFALNVGAYF